MNVRDCDVYCPHCGHKMVVLKDRALCGCSVVPTSGSRETEGCGVAVSGSSITGAVGGCTRHPFEPDPAPRALD